MQKNKNRTGLALGAIVALVSSLFVMTAPAQASETSVVGYPASGLETQTTVLVTEGFDLGLRFGTGVQSVDRAVAGFGVVVTKTAALDMVASESAATGGVITASPSASATFTFGVVSTSGVALSFPSATSVSASVTVTVTPFIDLNADGVKDAGETSGTPITLTFVPYSGLGATISIASPLTGETSATASFAVSAGVAFNWSMLDNDFKIRTTVSSVSVVATLSDAISGVQMSDPLAAVAVDSGVAGGTVRNSSGSHLVPTLALTGGVSTLSSGIEYNDVVLAVSNATAATAGVAGVVISYSATAENIAYSTSVHADARFNSAFTLDAYPYTVSSTQAAAVASAFTVSAVGAGMNFGAEAGVILNGTTYTSSASLLGAGFTLASGTKTVAVSTFGQLDSGAGETVTFKLSAQLEDASMTVTFRPTVQTVVYTPLTVSGLAGVAKSFALTAKDQWGVSSVRTDQRIAGSVVLGGSTSPTAYGAVVNGAATVVVTPTPAIRTGSAVVTFTLQTFDQGTQAYKDTGVADTAAFNVYSYVAGTDSITSRTVSISSSISYGAALSWSPTAVAVVVANSFSDVVASAPGLMIQNADSVAVTASDVLTIAANGKTANFKFTSRLAGTYTVTFTNGTATTTSTIIVDVAGHDSGATLTFDKASIAAGTTTTVTGTLKDVNGNPVMTSGSSNVSVAWSGKGLPFGNDTDMETDAAGQLTFYVLVLSGEVGDAAISATYKPAGLAVSTKNVTVVHAVAVGKAAATSADQKITIGTYKGYVGVFTKGYEGQKLSVRLASKWHVRNPIEDLKAGYSLLTVNTGVGYVANVIVYIDGVEVERMTITTK
jgi:hypothetical protein